MSEQHPLTLPATIYSQQPAEQVVSFLREHFAAVDDAPYQSTVLYIKAPTGEEVLIDTGAGGFSPDNSVYEGATRRHLEAIGVTPDRIQRVFFSHWHPDHFGGAVDQNGELVYPQAHYYLSRQELAWWQSGPDLSGMRVEEDFQGFLLEVGQGYLTQLAGKLEPIEPEQEVLPGIRALAAPGHTPGNLAFVVESEGKTLLVAGDAFVHHLITPAHPEWECDLDVEPAQAVQTRKALLEFAAKTECLALVYHHSLEQCLGRVRREKRGDSNGYVWEPAEYRW